MSIISQIRQGIIMNITNLTTLVFIVGLKIYSTRSKRLGIINFLLDWGRCLIGNCWQVGCFFVNCSRFNGFTFSSLLLFPDFVNFLLLFPDFINLRSTLLTILFLVFFNISHCQINFIHLFFIFLHFLLL